MERKPINLAEKFSKFSEHWSPKIIAQLNDYHFKLSKLQGEFIWHSHPETDEAFLIVKGSMTIHFRDGEVELKEGDLFVVPRGVEHKPYAREECSVLVVERAGTVNTGNAGGPRTADPGSWI